MLEIEDSNDDLKTQSLSLFRKHVSIRLRSDSETCINHGNPISGKLTGRVWGERLGDENTLYETVIAITIMTPYLTEISIPYQDILALEELKE